MKSSFWILISIATRPLMWFLASALLGAVFFLSNLLTSEYDTLGVQILHDGDRLRTEQDLRQAAQPESTMVAVQVDFGAIAWERVDQIMPHTEIGSVRHVRDAEEQNVDKHLAALPMPKNVEAVETGNWEIRQSTIDKLGQLDSLKRLGVLVTDNDSLDLTPWANLQQLEMLDLGLFSSKSTSLQPLSQLPRLTTLALGSQLMISPEHMAEVAQIPGLKTLYLPDVTETPSAMRSLEQLKESNSLVDVYVAVSLDEPDKLQALSDAIPGINVVAAKYLPARSFAFGAAVWMSLIIGGMTLHFVAMFTTPMSELVPGFKVANQRMVWSVVFLVVIGLTGMVCWFGANALPVFSALAFYMTFAMRDGFAAQLAFGESPGMRRFSGLVPALAFIVLLLSCYWHPAIVERYLLAVPIWIPICLLMLTAMQVVNTSQKMNSFCRERMERGKPILLSMHDIQRASAQNQQRTEAEVQGQAAMDGAFARANQLSTLFGCGALATMFVFSVSGADITSGDFFDRFIAMACCLIGLWSVFVIGVKWWRNMPYLTGMLVRPPGRRQQIDQVFRGVASDFVRIVPVALANVLLIINANIFAQDDVLLRVVISCLLIGSVVAICYAVIVWTLVIRSLIGVAVLCLLVYFCITTLTVAAMILGAEMPPSSLAVTRVLFAIALLMVIAATAIIAARQYYKRLEWGRFA